MAKIRIVGNDTPWRLIDYEVLLIGQREQRQEYLSDLAMNSYDCPITTPRINRDEPSTKNIMIVHCSLNYPIVITNEMLGQTASLSYCAEEDSGFNKRMDFFFQDLPNLLHRSQFRMNVCTLSHTFAAHLLWRNLVFLFRE